MKWGAHGSLPVGVKLSRRGRAGQAGSLANTWYHFINPRLS